MQKPALWLRSVVYVESRQGHADQIDYMTATGSVIHPNCDWKTSRDQKSRVANRRLAISNQPIDDGVDSPSIKDT